MGSQLFSDFVTWPVDLYDAHTCAQCTDQAVILRVGLFVALSVVNGPFLPLVVSKVLTFCGLSTLCIACNGWKGQVVGDTSHLLRISRPRFPWN